MTTYTQEEMDKAVKEAYDNGREDGYESAAAKIGLIILKGFCLKL